MRIFITGASGFIGSVVTKKLISFGHEVIGLARSNESAVALTNAGVKPLHGSLEDIEILKKGAGESDGVINLGFNHDFSQFSTSIQVELRAIEVMGEVLEGKGLPFVIASGAPTITEKIDLNDSTFPRMASAVKVLELAKHNVRSSIVRLAPCVHDETKGGFLIPLIDIAKRTGVSGYAGNGSNRWCAVHRMDAAQLFCLAFEKAPAGSVLQAVADMGIPLKLIAEKIGQRLNIPIRPIPDEDIEKHFGWLSMAVRNDFYASSTITQKLIDWKPTYPGLLDDIDHGHFFDDL
jgi:nucleoside-diphosphate-sugar epimerase